MGGKALTSSEILIRAQIIRIGLAKEPTVKHLIEIIQIVLSTTIALSFSSCSLLDSQANLPTIVLPNSLQHIPPTLIKRCLEIPGTCINIEPWILTVSIGSTATLVGSDLHETLLAISSSHIRITSRLLHGKRHKNGSRHTVGLFGSFEGPKNLFAGGEDGRGGSLGGRHDFKLGERKVRRLPASGGETTVEEVLRTVGLVIVGTGGTAVVGGEAEEAARGRGGGRGGLELRVTVRVGARASTRLALTRSLRVRARVLLSTVVGSSSASLGLAMTL